MFINLRKLFMAWSRQHV